jgi:5-methylthioadenosine/S-adenosylhomocysteine deaminase
MDIRRRLFMGSALASPLLLTTAAACSRPEAGMPATDVVVIRGARRAVTMDPALGELQDVDILVENGVIGAVGPNLDAPGADEVDASRWWRSPDSSIPTGTCGIRSHAVSAPARQVASAPP